MYTKQKKSLITDWWVAESNLKMAFVNILSGEPLSENLLIVGYLNRKKRELATSTNRVVRVTKEGVITSQGTFYPFEEAHDLYLNFLIEANKEDTLIAFNWEYKKKSSKNIITADIIRDGNIETGITFDFIPISKYNVMFAGYSKQLSSNIILSTFDKRNVCIKIEIPKEVKKDIFRSSFATKKETIEKVRAVQEIFADK